MSPSPATELARVPAGAKVRAFVKKVRGARARRFLSAAGDDHMGHRRLRLAALDVGFVSRVGAIGGFAIQRVEVVVVAVDDVTVVATVLVEVRLFRARREVGGLVVAVVVTELAIVRRGGRVGCLITLAVAGGILVAVVPIGVAGGLLGEV
jgi:hypothetical protein